MELRIDSWKFTYFGFKLDFLYINDIYSFQTTNKRSDPFTTYDDKSYWYSQIVHILKMFNKDKEHGDLKVFW